MSLNFNIRQAVLLKVPKTEDGLREMMEDAISKGEEVTLPGLGVLFEVLWQECSTEDQNEMLSTLRERVQNVTQ
ncbi:MAG: small acid-soluble spore protein SspI [Bacilli bacterium]